MNKFKYLFTYQLKQKLTAKSFLVSNIIIFVVLMLLLNINNIVRAFDDGSDGADLVYVYNQTGYVNIMSELEVYEDEISSQLGTSGVYFEAIASFDPNSYEFNGSSAILVINQEGESLSADLFIKDLNVYKRTSIQNALEKLRQDYLLEDKTPEEKELIIEFLTPMDFIPHLTEDTQGKEILSGIASFVSLPIFMLIIFAVQAVGASIVEEKQTKAVEYIIANVSPNKHFFAKILTNFVFLTIQLLLILVYALIGGLLSIYVFGGYDMSAGLGLSDTIALSYGIDNATMDNIMKQLPLTVFFFIGFTGLGGLLYMIVMGFVASISNSNEDYGQFQTPLMMLMLGGFYAAMFGTMFGDTNIIIKIMAYIPVFSPFMAPSLYLAGAFNWIEALISLVILAGTSLFMYKLIMPMYKNAILSYSTDKMTVRIKKAFSRSKHNK